ncbi:phage antirepressor KilAC domain-containing protein [Paenibacillus hamazuiensis]|uniref:phage antirepressor KilAC domain-containing protein n=1 Tax=Paenibacillus hamazuiensis TaxID=2936508 RepID=UPI00200D53F7|nr:phage antirepressor KilAC domain-containing protein [Paenibacillus hamazuiensis]
MDEVQRIFNFGSSELRTVIRGGEPWFVVKDVCTLLGLGNVGQAVTRIESDEIADVILNDGRQGRSFLVVNEPGLYSLILTSRKPEARAFKRWITHDVIPAIRKTGGYVSDDDLFVKTYLPNADESTQMLFRSTLEVVRKANEKMAVMQPKADAFDTLMSADGTQSMAQAAKALGYGRNEFMSILRDRGILMDGTNRNTPYERYVKAGYFTVVEAVRNGVAYPTTRVTPRGLGFLESALRKRVGT